MAEQPKSGFYIAVGLVVAALIGFAIYRGREVYCSSAGCPARRWCWASWKIDPKEIAKPAESSQDTSSPTTVKEYTSSGRPRSCRRSKRTGKGVQAARVNNTVRFALEHKGRLGTDCVCERRSSRPEKNGRRRAERSSRSIWF